MLTKIILGNDAAFARKYGAASYGLIQAALQGLIAADATRGIQTRYVPLDSAAAMAPFGGAAPVTQPADPQQNKAAVDAVYRSATPEYLVLLGAGDIVPHQPLDNPAYAPPEPDCDQFVPSDLPYACEAPYSTRIGDFVGATRVVGRLPDITNTSDPAYLVSLLNTARSAAAPGPVAAYDPYFGLSAADWAQSTALSLTAIFGSSAALFSAPVTALPPAPASFRSRVHFINCHGAEIDQQFYGQGGGLYPPAMTASGLAGQVELGTVIAAECCYGAELYDPTILGGQAGIANTYLHEGAYGFFGSTTIAYGPATTNGSADLICQYFLQSVRRGSSLGRAALEARQTFCRASTCVDPIDQKTLAQFILLGDPSIQPVVDAPVAKAFAADATAVRRLALFKSGLVLASTTPVAIPDPDLVPSPAVRDELQRIAGEYGMTGGRRRSYRVRNQRAETSGLPKGLLTKAPDVTSFHLLYANDTEQPARLPHQPRSAAVVIAAEADNAISTVRVVYTKALGRSGRGTLRSRAGGGIR